MSIEAQAAGLAMLGYRRVSRRYCLIARLDRPDWQDYIPYKIGDWNSRADQYRRVYAHHIQIDWRVFRVLTRIEHEEERCQCVTE